MQYLYLVPICLAIAAVFIVIEKMGRYLVADVIKGVASAFFVLLGLLSAFMCNDVVFARMVLFGLVLGAVADVLLNLRYVYEGSKAQLAFLAGILGLSWRACGLHRGVPALLPGSLIAFVRVRCWPPC